jgi:hypothetical protein
MLSTLQLAMFSLLLLTLLWLVSLMLLQPKLLISNMTPLLLIGVPIISNVTAVVFAVAGVPVVVAIPAVVSDTAVAGNDMPTV